MQIQSGNDTIFAPVTPAGVSGVAVFRLSGNKAMQALESLSGKPCPVPRMAVLRTFMHPISRETIDHGLAIFFPAPHSFTGEDVVELHLHGGRSVWRAITEALAALPGLRLAEPGEFTRRAFIHGKMDLTAAEGIADLIHAETRAQHKQALRMVEGELEKLHTAVHYGADTVRGVLARVQGTRDRLVRLAEGAAALRADGTGATADADPADPDGPEADRRRSLLQHGEQFRTDSPGCPDNGERWLI